MVIWSPNLVTTGNRYGLLSNRSVALGNSSEYCITKDVELINIWIRVWSKIGLPWWLSCKELTCLEGRHGRHKFNPWVRKIPWRRKWQPIPLFLPGKSHGWRRLVGYSPWGHKESDMTEQFHLLLLMSQFTKLFTNTNYVMVLVITTNHLMLVSHRLSSSCKVTATKPEHKTWPSDSYSFILFFPQLPVNKYIF